MIKYTRGLTMTCAISSPVITVDWTRMETKPMRSLLRLLLSSLGREKVSMKLGFKKIAMKQAMTVNRVAMMMLEAALSQGPRASS